MFGSGMFLRWHRGASTGTRVNWRPPPPHACNYASANIHTRFSGMLGGILHTILTHDDASPELQSFSQFHHTHCLNWILKRTACTHTHTHKPTSTTAITKICSIFICSGGILCWYAAQHHPSGSNTARTPMCDGVRLNVCICVYILAKRDRLARVSDGRVASKITVR